MNISHLRTEYRIAPQGIDVPAPRFSWVLEGTERGAKQTQYVLTLRTESMEVLWQTRADSDMPACTYAGAALAPLTRYYWQVQCTVAPSGEVQTSPWTEFTTGKMGTSWTGSWIHSQGTSASAWAGVYFRKGFAARPGLLCATLAVTAQGWYTAYINGNRVGTDCFTPGWTVDAKHIPYQCYDVTSLVDANENMLGAELGKGFSKGDFFAGWEETDFHGKKPVTSAAPPSFRAELHLLYEDGGREVIATDETWKWAPSPRTFSHIYMGEHYDARLEDAAWCHTSGSLSAWKLVTCDKACSIPLTAAESESARVQQYQRPQALFTTPKGETVLDMGQNMVGWVRFAVQGRAGDTVRLRFFEVLDAQGNVYTENLRKAQTTLVYTLKGGEKEGFAPSFTYFGFRYVHIEAWPEGAVPKAEDFLGEVVFTRMERTGFFTSSHPLVNRFFENTVWGLKGNFVDVPTDCPQRDERLGWMGDAQVFCRTASFIMQVDPFFTKWLRDVALEQTADGDLPHVVPNVLGPAIGSAAWGDAGVICPWTLYRVYGDVRLLERQYPSMCAWVEHIVSTGSHPYRWDTGFHFGDWLSLDVANNESTGSTDCYFVAQAMFVYSADLTAQAAEVLGKAEDAAHFRFIAQEARKAFCDEYMTPNGRIAVRTQTACVLVLMFDLVPPEHRAPVMETLVKLLEEKDFHIATGFVGTPYILHVLTRMGRHDLAMKVFLQEDYPGWLYPVTKGATTIWERWDGIKPDGSFQTPAMNSYNHYAYGSVCDWLVQRVAGLDLDDKVSGYRRVTLRPGAADGLTSAQARYMSVLGEFVCGWEDTQEGIRKVHVAIPVGAEATLLLERANAAAVLEGGKPIAAVQDICAAKTCEDGCAAWVLGSGEYLFQYPLQ